MILLIVIVMGLILGSFVNAFVWRFHEQDVLRDKKPKDLQKKLDELSIVHGRSMCPHCRHELAPKDLIPIVSWLILKGKCRYCHHFIEDTPIPELITAVLFCVSYLYWPLQFRGYGLISFILWLMFIVGFIILAVYDIRWFLLPDKIVWPLVALGVIRLLIHIIYVPHQLVFIILNTIGGVVVTGGLFYVLFILSNGRWIGGGDVKLGLLLGMLAGGILQGVMLLFFSSVLGSLVSIPLLMKKSVKKDSLIPFGPFLIGATIIVVLCGTAISNWLNGFAIG